MTRTLISIAITAALGLPAVARAQGMNCEEQSRRETLLPVCSRTTPDFTDLLTPPAPPPEAQSNPIRLRVLKYTEVAQKHRLRGLASYYSTSLDGTLTATGAIFRNRKLTAAHLTLPLGTWVEVTARATKKKIRLLVNDRGPYVKKFCLDLSQAAARALGVDVAEDRLVDIRIIALPGERPLPEDWELATTKEAETMMTAEAR